MQPIRRLTGTEDVAEEEYLALKEAREALQAFLHLHGYRLLDTPVLEETDLFFRKSGGELAARMYSFTDPGGRRVSLRPEFTSSVIRAYLERRDSTPIPWRVQYAGPVFRHDPAATSPYRQFTQVGAELIGSSSPLADAEVLSLACRALAHVGLQGARLTVGHVGAVASLLEGFQLSERARVFLVSHLGALRQGGQARETVAQAAYDLGLLGQERAMPPDLLKDLPREGVDDLARALLQDSADTFLGSRSPQEVLARFLRKLSGTDDPRRVERGLEFAERLAQVRAEPREALERVRETTEAAGLNIAALEGCQRLVEALEAHDLADTPVVLDFSLVRSIAYYTGMVFEMEHPAAPGEPSLCGGGRYDGLVRALGGTEDVPALGFACSLERLVGALRTGGRASELGAPGVMVMAATPEALPHALGCAQRWRGQDTPAEVDISGRSLEENLAYAQDRGLGAVITVESDGQEREHPVATRTGAPAPGRS